MSEGLGIGPADRLETLREADEALERIRQRRAAGPNHRPLDEATRALAERPPEAGGRPLGELLDAFVEIATTGWDKTAAGNFSFIPTGSVDLGAVAAFLAAGADTFTGAAFEAPAMVALEHGVLRWIATDVLGLPNEAGGLLLSGGSLANQTALVAARARLDPAASGTMYASSRVHHSVTKAARLIGVPADRVRLVEPDRSGRCDVAALRAAIRADRSAGHVPFLVVGIAGATDTGVIDPLAEMAAVANGAGAWFHVDAAYGGFFGLTGRGRARMHGIERADSVTIDAHKGLFLPYGVGALVVRDVTELVAAHEGRGSYLRGLPVVDDLPNFFERGPELTRPNRAPLIWLPLQVHGVDAFRDALDRMLDLAEAARDRLATVPGVVVGDPPDLSIVTFRAAAGDDATDAITTALNASGRFQVSTTVIDGHAAIRFAFLNPRTTIELVADAIALVEATVRGTIGPVR